MRMPERRSTVEYRVLCSRFWQNWKDMVIFKTLHYYGVNLNPVFLLLLTTVCGLVLILYLYSYMAPLYYGTHSQLGSITLEKSGITGSLKQTKAVPEAIVVKDGVGDMQRSKRTKRSGSVRGSEDGEREHGFVRGDKRGFSRHTKVKEGVELSGRKFGRVAAGEKKHGHHRSQQEAQSGVELLDFKARLREENNWKKTGRRQHGKRTKSTNQVKRKEEMWSDKHAKRQSRNPIARHFKS